MRRSPSTDNYTISKAEIFLADYGSNAYRHVGNAPTCTLALNVETLEHFSAMAGVREKDFEAVTQTGATLSLTLEEFTPENLARALLGAATDYTQAAGTAQTVTVTGVEAGATYDLGATDLSNVSIDDGEVAPVAYVAGTHYTVNAAAGTITVLEIPATAGADMEVTFDAAAVQATSGRGSVGILKDTAKEVALLAVGTNDVGVRYKFVVPRLKLQPTGDIALISDEINQIQLQGSALRDAASPNFPFGRAIELA